MKPRWMKPHAGGSTRMPPHLLLRKEFDELFDTTPDLTGADLDISRFIRSDDERDLQVFWLDIPADKQRRTTLYTPPRTTSPIGGNCVRCRF
jgi:hypothetical protein